MKTRRPHQSSKKKIQRNQKMRNPKRNKKKPKIKQTMMTTTKTNGTMKKKVDNGLQRKIYRPILVALARLI